MRIPTTRLGLPTIDTRIAPPPPKRADDHYGSGAHKKWRLDVMRQAGWKCQAPGCTRSAPTDRLYADHIVEIKDGGSALDPRNGQALCSGHHVAKSNRMKREREGRDLR